MNKPREAFLLGLLPGESHPYPPHPFEAKTVVFFDDVSRSHKDEGQALTTRKMRLLAWTAKYSLPWDYGHLYPSVPVMDYVGEYASVWTAHEHFRKVQYGPKGEEYFQWMSLRLFLYRESLVEWLKSGNVGRQSSYLVVPQCYDPDGELIPHAHLLATYHG